jgi:hypothetical protein
VRVSAIVEWANTTLNGQRRADQVLAEVGRQWQALVDGKMPPGFPDEPARWLDRIDPRLDVRIVSGHAIAADRRAELRGLLPESCAVSIEAREGLEYYELKNHGGARAAGDLLLFLDSDVLPDDGWLAWLLGSFADPDVHVVAGQTYVAPRDVWAAAFALGWTYDLREPAAGLVRPRKLYANNIVFRAGVFRRTGFSVVSPKSRGASSRLLADLGSLGITAWENRRAGVDHPPPADLAHLVVRALAHGRDQHLKASGRRGLAGLARSLAIAAARLGRGVGRAGRHWRRVGLRPWQVPAAVAIIGLYYGVFALGGLLTLVAPAVMIRRFRV